MYGPQSIAVSARPQSVDACQRVLREGHSKPGPVLAVVVVPGTPVGHASAAIERRLHLVLEDGLAGSLVDEQEIAELGGIHEGVLTLSGHREPVVRVLGGETPMGAPLLSQEARLSQVGQGV